MKYVLWFAPNVHAEVARIHAYREKDTKGSGDRFLAALTDCYQLIGTNPVGYQVRKGPIALSVVVRNQSARKQPRPQDNGL